MINAIRMTWAVGLLAVAGCSREAAPVAPAVTEVQVVPIEARAVTLTTELLGHTTEYLVSDVRPQVAGIIKQRTFEEGATVAAGQVLYQIDPATYQAAFEQAKADLANSQASVAAARLKNNRYHELLEIQGVSQQDADDARTAYEQSVAEVALKRAALESARINLGYTQIRAPISGRIGKSSVTPGALVTANQDTALATIRALDPIYVDVTQSSTQLLRLKKLLAGGNIQSGRTDVTLKLEDGSEYSHTGSLKFQEVAVDTTTGSVTLRAEFPNPDGMLLPGMFVRAVVSEAQNSAAILAPQRGVSRDAKGNATALVLGRDNVVEMRTLTVDRTIGSDWLVSSGLQAGDQLIVDGLSKIRVGETVKPLRETVATARNARS
jgi:membrane fusion protein (multidrug efflux system)